MFLREPLLEIFGLRNLLSKYIEMGFDCIEIPEKWKFRRDDISLLRDFKRKNNLRYSFHSSNPYGEVNLLDMEDEELKRKAFLSLRRAKEVGADLVVFDLDPVRERRMSRYYPFLISLLREIMDYGNELGVQPCIEIGDPRENKLGSTPSSLKKILRKVDGLGIALDFGHLYASSLYYGYDPESLIDEFKGRILHTHVCDNLITLRALLSPLKMPKSRLDLHLPLGVGDLPWRRWIALLRKGGYKGMWILEIKPARLTKDRKKMIFYIQDSYRRLKKEVMRPIKGPVV